MTRVWLLSFLMTSGMVTSQLAFTTPWIIRAFWGYVRQIDERLGVQSEQSKAEHLERARITDPLRSRSRPQPQRLQFQYQSLQFCHGCLLRPVGVPKTYKSHHLVERILLYYTEAVELPSLRPHFKYI
jgi:hypothetical protein